MINVWMFTLNSFGCLQCFAMFLMTIAKEKLQVDWEEYYSHYLVDLLGLDQVEIGNCWGNVTILTKMQQCCQKLED